jgi:type IV pilus secretin PilQ/predicted competence protein
MYRYTALLMLCVAMTIGARSPLAAGAEVATLKKIVSRVDGRAGVVAIEASDPVPYVASQPEPLQFVVELRDIVAVGFADNFKPDPRHPFSAVQVETATGADGASVARVRMTLAHPLRPRVRSSRNMIYVEADRLDRSAIGAGVVSGTGPSSAIRDVRVARRGSATAITLHSTGRLQVSGVEESKEGPPRLFIDIPNATSALSGTTPIGAGPVDAVRVGLNIDNPLVTRVTMDLTRKAPYKLESSPNGNDLTVVFDSAPPADTLTPASASAPSTQVVSARLQGPTLEAAVAPPSQAPPAVALQAVQAAPPQGPAPAGQAAPAPAPVPAAQGAAGQTQQPVGGVQRFTGFPVSLDFQGADLRAVLRTFAEISGLNIVIDPSIQGTVDVALRDVPWDQALDIILRANRLGYVIDGTIVRIAPLTVLADEEAQRQKLAEAQALAGTLSTTTRTLSYARAELVQPMLTATVLSQRGSITTDVRTNTLIITDLQERLTRANDLIATLDRPEPQVEIEARIVQTTRDFARRIGVQWGFLGRADVATGNTLPLAFPNQVSVAGRATGAAMGPEGVAPTVNLGIDPSTSAIGLALGSVNGALNLDVALTALEESGQGRLLSTPRVTTQNNIAAMIEQGVQIPIQTVANNTVTVSFRPAALRLNVTPQITAANTVIMIIEVVNESPDFSRAVNGIPPIDSQNARTQVLVNNGETTVIGGIYVSNEQAQQDRTPGLYRIPLLGWLFQRNELTDGSRELLIFITPRIIRL